MKKRVLIASSSLLALPTFERLRERGDLDLLGLITTPDRAKGRHATPSPNELAASPVIQTLPIFKPADESSLNGFLDELEPDLIVVIAYGRLIRQSALDKVPLGWINLHFSLLPAYRGAAPVQRSLLAREERFGITVFKLDEGMDTGPIIRQERIDVAPGTNATDLLSEMAARGSDLITLAIDDLVAGLEPHPQSGPPSMAPKIAKPELRLNLDLEVEDLFAQIMAFTERPGVWFLLRGKRHIITRAKLSAEIVSPGCIGLIHNQALLGTGGRAIEIERIIPEGRREMSGVEWLRGLRLNEGDRIDSEELK